MSHIGWRAPLHSTAMGKVLLSFSQNKLLAKHIEQTQYTPNTITNRDLLEMELERIRERGWAIDDEETQLGVRCYAAPVKNYEGRVIAAISASGPIVRTTPRNKDFVVKAAKELSNKMGCPSC